mgnify:CR=1 FL=1
MPECWFTVVMPGYGISTPEAFAAYDKVGSSVHPDCAAQEAAIRAGDLDAVCAAAGNALEECSGAKDNEAIKAALRENGAVTALMTGSGAAVFGVFRTEAEAKAAADASAPAGRRSIRPSLSGEGRRCRYCGRDEASLRTTSQSGLRPPRPGCGTQHPQRFACVLLAAAPTTTPCFRHWRRSSLLPLVGEPLAKRLSFAKCQRLSLWESWRVSA